MKPLVKSDYRLKPYYIGSINALRAAKSLPQKPSSFNGLGGKILCTTFQPFDMVELLKVCSRKTIQHGVS